MEAAKDYVDPEKGVNTPEEALQGASDIIAEEISDSAALRKTLRLVVRRHGKIRSRQTGDEDSVYRLYYDFSQPVSRMPGPSGAGHQPGREGEVPEGISGAGSRHRHADRLSLQREGPFPARKISFALRRRMPMTG